MSRYPQSVVFWGAGATASIGLPLTARQAEFLRSLAPHFDSGDQPLERRVRDALGDLAIAPWDGALSDLLAILGDDDNNVVRPGAPTNVLPNQFTAMTRNWPSAGEDALRQRIVELRTLYDWPALAAAINVCPKQSDRSSFELQDLFNVLDMNLQTGHGFRVHDDLFLTPQRVLGARGALVLLIQALFYIAWHARGRTHENLEHHHDFAKAMARRMQREGVQLAADLGDEKLETDDFIRGDVAFVSMNWDPLGLWPQFVANGELNRDRAVPRVGSPAKRLQIFHDLGHFVGGPRVKKKDRPGSRVWQPMNESSARQLNDPDHEGGRSHPRLEIPLPTRLPVVARMSQLRKALLIHRRRMGHVVGHPAAAAPSEGVPERHRFRELDRRRCGNGQVDRRRGGRPRLRTLPGAHLRPPYAAGGSVEPEGPATAFSSGDST